MKHGSFGNKGGIYMGLGLVRDRMGKTRDALPILHQALDHYQREHTRGYVSCTNRSQRMGAPWALSTTLLKAPHSVA